MPVAKVCLKMVKNILLLNAKSCHSWMLADVCADTECVDPEILDIVDIQDIRVGISPKT